MAPREFTQHEWSRVNKDLKFEDLKVGMEVNIGDFFKPGLYQVSKIIYNGSRYSNKVVLNVIKEESK